MTNIYENYCNRLKKAELETKSLTIQLKNLNDAINESKSSLKNEELNSLVLENTKLKHRLSILNRAVAAEQSSKHRSSKLNTMKTNTGLYSTLVNIFSEGVQNALPDVPDPPVDIALPSGVNKKLGDYQCNAALQLCVVLKSQGVKTNPRSVAEKIIQHVPVTELISAMEIAGPGFINIKLSPLECGKMIKNLLIEGVNPPNLEKKLRVVIDFSSPNIAKEMHVGHLRSTIIGESIARLLEYLGHDVLRLNHVGDWGTQFGMLIAHLQDKFPDYDKVSPPLGDLQAFYKESKVRFDEDEEFKKRAYECVVKLQGFEPEHTRAWNLICDVSRAGFQEVYNRLDIKLIERGESFYQTRMNDVVRDLEEKNLLEESEGRKIMWGTESAIPFTIVKSQGGYTYDTSDMATIKQRIEEEKADWIIYVTDSGQSTHFQILRECAIKAGILDPSKVRMDHVPFGVVLGEDKKRFKTRSGETVRLIDLLDEGLRRAKEKLESKDRDKALTSEEFKAAQESVAYGCIKYADLSRNRNQDYIFSFDKMLEDKGNTAVYLIYALTRIKAISRTAGLTQQQLEEGLKNVEFRLEHEKEFKLAKNLLRFPDELILVTKDLCPHHLCEYLYELACTFTEFYDSCYCVEKNSTGEIIKVNMDRILLCEATARVMEQCFSILGLKPVEKM